MHHKGNLKGTEMEKCFKIGWSYMSREETLYKHKNISKLSTQKKFSFTMFYQVIKAFLKYSLSEAKLSNAVLKLFKFFFIDAWLLKWRCVKLHFVSFILPYPFMAEKVLLLNFQNGDFDGFTFSKIPWIRKSHF